jgi:hypothetical protein
LSRSGVMFSAVMEAAAKRIRQTVIAFGFIGTWHFLAEGRYGLVAIETIGEAKSAGQLQ